MNLITDSLRKRLQKAGDQRSKADPMIFCRLYDPQGRSEWFVASYDAATDLAWGYVKGQAFDEWGSFPLADLEAHRLPPYGMKIERDLHFVAQPMSRLMPKVARERNESLQAIEQSKRKNQRSF